MSGPRNVGPRRSTPEELLEQLHDVGGEIYAVSDGPRWRLRLTGHLCGDPLLARQLTDEAAERWAELGPLALPERCDHCGERRVPLEGLRCAACESLPSSPA